ncbi:uncharacterized protein LOC132735285 [Ruditapes philippinarum]|uniref:uncharacterized protein LOC132735285 n=1 Tax=Ruditapes philippinarum TaxID=129788 RepID=UPI00295AB676|nr:uncharacterized protein LOC132735285 [Ruditapes philippinarum]
MLSAKERYLSKCMSQYLDELGFDHERIQERIRFNTKLSKAIDLSTKCLLKSDKFEEIIAGSTSEGIGMLCTNDLDVLHINHAVICCDSWLSTENDKLKFKMVRQKAPAGYTFLKLMCKGTDSETYKNIEYALVKRKTEYYLSSKQYMTKNDENILQIIKGSFLSKMTYVKKPQGPSIPTFFEEFDKDGLASSLDISDQGVDFVRAFSCQQDDEFLIAWKGRNRKFGWPSKENIDKVMSLPVHVVAVGKEGTKTKVCSGESLSLWQRYI